MIIAVIGAVLATRPGRRWTLRNVLAVVGGATILADFTTIKFWLILPMLILAFLIWFLDYERHFRGQTVEEAKIVR